MKELGCPKITDKIKATVTQNLQGTKWLCSIQIRKAADMAERYREYKEYCWQCKLANMSAELGRVKTAQEKKAIEQRIQKEGENQEWKRKMWKVIQKAREECNARLYRKLTKVIELNSTCASYGKSLIPLYWV